MFGRSAILYPHSYPPSLTHTSHIPILVLPRRRSPGTGASTLLAARPEARGGALRHGRGVTRSVGAQGAHTGGGRRHRGAQRGRGACQSSAEGSCAGGGGGDAGGEEGDAGPAVLSGGRSPFQEPWRPVLGGRGLPGGGVWHSSVCTADTVSTPPIGWCPSPVVRGFAPGTQPMGRAGEYSGCGVVWWGVVCHMWTASLPGGCGQWNSFCALPHSCGQLAVDLLECTVSLPQSCGP